MHRSTSIFLDTLRFTAACVVFLSHVTEHNFNAVWPWVPWGHEAVVVFFVMSGFVIAHVVHGRERDVREYMAARLGRLYSVVLPALLLTVLLDGLGRHLAPALYATVPSDHTAMRLLANGLFLQQNWNLTVIPLSNGPFWSLGYEFWYYMIFGAATLTTGRLRLFLPLLLCLCAGPRIVAYLPLWLLGVAAYRAYQHWHPPAWQRHLALSTCAIAFVSILATGSPLAPVRQSLTSLFPDDHIPVGGFRLFVGGLSLLPEDMLLGILVALAIASVRGDYGLLMRSPRVVALIRYLAGATFTLYLFHMPLLYFLTAQTGADRSSRLETGMLAMAVFASCILLSHLGERQVGAYRQLFRQLLERIPVPAKPGRPLSGNR